MTTNNDESLKPCAHCGCTHASIKSENAEGGGVFLWAICRDCQTSSAKFYTSEDCPIMRQQVRNAWNRRAPQAAPMQEINVKHSFTIPSPSVAMPVADPREEFDADLAEIRDMFPIPDIGSPLEQQWAAAMADPHEVVGYVRAALASRAEPVKDGYVMVPVEPTEEMVAAADKARIMQEDDCDPEHTRTNSLSTLGAMLNAAPKDKP